jgi:hypothetical protein
VLRGTAVIRTAPETDEIEDGIVVPDTLLVEQSLCSGTDECCATRALLPSQTVKRFAHIGFEVNLSSLHPVHTSLYRSIH